MPRKYIKDFLRTGVAEGVECKFSRNLEKLNVVIEGKWLGWSVEETTKLHPEEYQENIAEFIRVALTKEINRHVKIQLS